MVQRKAPPQPVANMRSHEKKLDRQTSCSHSQQQQDSRTKGGGGGGGDLKKKKMKMMKLERSIRAADLENLSPPPPPPPPPLNPKRTSSSPIKRSPNYMKPTSSSDARKEKLLLQVTTVHHPHVKTDHKMRSPQKSSPSTVAAAVVVKPLKALSRQSSLKGVVRPVIKNLRGVVVNRATCSSTLKDSKFPEALDLSPGGTEAEGTSLFKVCPYSYCSLNAHRHHEPLPPLRCFVSARRKLLKTQKSMKFRTLPSIRRVNVSEKDKEKVDSEKEEAASSVGISPQVPDDDFFIEIYAGKPEGCVVNGMLNSQKEYEAEEEHQVSDVEDGKCSGDGKEDQMRSACADATVDDDDLGQKSEISNEEMDIFSMCSFEHVECDKHVEDAKEVEDYTSSQASNIMAESENKVSTFDFDYEEELKSLFSDNMMESSDITDDEFDSMSLLNEEHSVGRTVDLTAESVAEINEDRLEESAQDGDCIPPTDQEYQETATENTDGGELGGSNTGSHDEVEVSSVAADQDIVREEDGIQNRQDTEEYFEESCCSDEQSDESCLEESHEESENEQQQEQVNSEEGKSKARTRISRSKADEEVNKTRDFNPRGPRFLDVEPEPEGEKVDLRHQELDERKNSEEWMVDHALQQAVTKLAPSRRRKVALLVEAFETVMPLPPYEKPLRGSTSGFIQPRFMQACS